jgi:CLIP-associating protein 1/2
MSPRVSVHWVNVNLSDGSRNDLKRITEVFTRMFHDPHGKVFSVFLDALVQVVSVYHVELNDWLYICLTRLLNKTGADLLASVQAKIQKALDIIRSVDF